ncbi:MULTISPECIES: efflux RND transporter permease subunit [Chryseobacterium]|uniref:Efflux pump membrane transporter BepE n=1 Tax=Chryseobacterium taihuense TaxID=1141221 RepID=A0A4V6IDC8_9FLAO|nr:MULTISPECIES: efflux RND transporter permease subunit [Chryseobacterium]QQV03943.1 efflux RND transporter permease subunit [Chryseobacterium sp. FDAARGOS 1104]VFB02704.1 Efflux pump membrane transporter BepE [Chryseobacterium taihuense]
MIKNFINRPVLSTVISIMIVILGVLGLTALPVTQYPDIAPTTVSVRANYTGANAETVMKSVVVPLEEQINGVEGMDYITSTAGNDGSAQIQVFFKQGIDPDIAAVNVQNRVSRASPLLPSEVTRSGVVTQKQQTSALMYLSFYSENKNIDDVYLQNFLNINVIPDLQRINGVGEANVFGGKNYSMRVWLDPAKLAAYGITPSDVTTAINEQSREAAAGSLGQNSGSSFEYIIKYVGKFNDKEQYDNIIIKALPDGQNLMLRDVAKVELGGLSYTGVGENGNNPSISMGIFQTPGSNAQEIIENIKAQLKANESSYPEGVKYTFNFDTNEFLDASIEKVIHTLIEAFILVFIVVYIFLQDFRSTLIPAIAVPVSIVGTFFFLNLFGYSLNLLTLFALVLAIGIVVDDAIVVVEAVHAKMENGISNSKKATIEAMDEITGAIISITLVMAAVFIPVTFITGPTGVFYQQFGITLIIAIMISAVNALTLSPVLCSLFLKPHDAHHEDYKKKNFIQKFFYKFNIAFKSATERYARGFTFLIKHKWVTLVIFGITAGIIYWTSATMKKGFVPTEDRGIIFTDVQLPPGASMERTYNVLKTLQADALKIPGIQNVTISTGRGLLSGNGSNNGLAFVKLKPFDERKGDGLSSEEITKKLFGLTGKVPDAKVVFFQPPSVPGFGNSAGFEMVLLDRAGGEVAELDNKTNELIGNLMKRPEIEFAQTSFNTKYPQYQMEINVPLAKQKGVSVNSILETMQGYIGGVYSADFTKYGKQFRVMVQALPENRENAESLNQLYVKTAQGEMAPISQFVSLNRTYGPQSVGRYNLFTSVKITGANAPGYSSGDAIAAVQQVAEETLDQNYSVEFTGLSREELSSGSQTALIFALSLIFVYFILAAQYESYILPLTVVISLPLGVMGAYFGQKIMGLENNIYFQIALIMLVGLLAKNAILIVEFAVQRRHHGESIVTSAINAAKARLRPILMTSLAFIFGLLPLVLASGIGAVGNRSIATGAAIGLLIGTLLGVFVIPVLYVVFQTLQEKIKPIKQEDINLAE